jgi:addiction module HigA family antidote
MTYPAIDNLPPVHPGRIIRRELEELNMSARELSRRLGASENAITLIVNGDQGISAEMALRLGKAFGTGERYWMNLQSYYEAKVARTAMAGKLDAIEPLVAA